MKVEIELFGWEDDSIAEWEEDELEQLDKEIELFESFMSDIEYESYKVDKIDDYRYTISDLTGKQLNYIEIKLNNIESDMEICSIWIEEISKE